VFNVYFIHFVLNSFTHMASMYGICIPSNVSSPNSLLVRGDGGWT